MGGMGRRGARVGAGVAWGTGALLGLLASGEGRVQPAGDTGVLRQILQSYPGWFQAVVENADRHRLQILYTRIDRDRENRPLFRSFGYHLTDRYFYPASAVKLPAAILALEKLNDLGVPGLTRDTPLRIGVGSPGQTAVAVEREALDPGLLRRASAPTAGGPARPGTGAGHQPLRLLRWGARDPPAGPRSPPIASGTPTAT